MDRPAPPAQTRGIDLRMGYVPRGKRAKKKRMAGLAFDVDDEQADGVMPDAVLGPVRRGEGYLPRGSGRETYPKQSDIQVAANYSAAAALNSTLGGSASAAVLPEWTDGLAVGRPERRVSGNTRVEGGWDLDPASLDLIDASFQRAVERSQRGGQGKPAKEALQTAYVTATRVFQNMTQSAIKVRYDMLPRIAEGVTAKKQRDIPIQKRVYWTDMMRYEVASRSLDRMWSALRVTRESAGGRVLAEDIGLAIQKAFAGLRERSPASAAAALVAAEASLKGTTKTISDHFDLVRRGAVRLVMRAQSIDPSAREGHVRDDPTTGTAHVVESLFFGMQHLSVEREILEATTAEGLRYLFSPAAGRLFAANPVFGYELERVVIGDLKALAARAEAALRALKPEEANLARAQSQLAQLRAEVGAPPEDVQSAEGAVAFLKGLRDDSAAVYAQALQAVKTSFGVRVTIPPAPQGYRRDNVVMLFRSRPTPEQGGTGELRTDAILVASVPDRATYGPIADVKSVDGLPASFVIYYSVQADPEPPRVGSGSVVIDPANPDAGPHWEVVYDLAWLETVSGGNGRAHPIRNAEFARQMIYGYMSPVQEPLSEAAAHAPRVEVFVEHVPEPEQVRAGREQRRVPAKKLGLHGERVIVTYFTTPLSMGSMRSLSLDRVTSMQGIWRAGYPTAPGQRVADASELDPREEALYADILDVLRGLDPGPAPEGEGPSEPPAPESPAFVPPSPLSLPSSLFEEEEEPIPEPLGELGELPSPEGLMPPTGFEDVGAAAATTISSNKPEEEGTIDLGLESSLDDDPEDASRRFATDDPEDAGAKIAETDTDTLSKDAGGTISDVGGGGGRVPAVSRRADIDEEAEQSDTGMISASE